MKKVEEQFKTRSISFPKQLVSVSGKYKKLESLSKSSGSWIWSTIIKIIEPIFIVPCGNYCHSE